MKKLFLLMLLLCFLPGANKLVAQCVATLLSAPGTGDQTVCFNDSIVTIKYTLVPGDGFARFCGLPNGVIGESSSNGDTIIISGTPRESGVFDYYISSTRTLCRNVTHASGRIIVNALPELTITTSNNCNQLSSASVAVDSSIFVLNPDFEIFYKHNDHTKLTGFIPASMPAILGRSDTTLTLRYDSFTSYFLTFCDGSQEDSFDMAGWKWDNTGYRIGFGNATGYFADGITRQNHMMLNGSRFDGYDSLARGATQVLNDELILGETYTLTADYGIRTAFIGEPLKPMLNLYAGGVLLPYIDSVMPALEPGDFVTWKKIYRITNPAYSGRLKIEVGKDVEIGADSGWQILIDHITLKKKSINYNYQWNNLPASSQNSISDLFNGTNSLTVTDHSNLNCSIKKEFELFNPSPPTIIQHQPDLLVTKCAGSSTTFGVVATGIGLTYQWQKNGEPIAVTINPTANAATLVFDTVRVSDMGTYKVIIDNSVNCSIESQELQLTVNPLPAASINGTDTVCRSANAPIIFSGSAGRAPYTFIYNINNNDPAEIVSDDEGISSLLSATGSTGIFNHNLISVSDANGCIQPQNGTATITVIDKPDFTSPVTASVCDNSPFTYTATGSASGLSYKWKRRANNLITPPPAADSIFSDTIQDTLHNTSDQPVAVIYDFTLSNQTNCEDNFTVTVTVNPTPKTDSITDFTFCPGQLVNVPAFISSSPNKSFRWTSDLNIGFGTSGYGNIPSVPAVNTTDITITANIVVSIKASGDSCAGPDRNFKINVLPKPLLTSPVTTSVCDSFPFAYQALSSSVGTTFTWIRNAQAGISNIAASSNNNVINELLDNTTNLPIIVPYIFNLTTGTGTGCSTSETVFVTVNPTPLTDVVPDKKYCNGEPVNGIRFISSSPDSSFTWTSVPSIGFGASGSGDIPPFFAGNPGNTPTTATITISITASSDHCPGPNSSFAITVNPSPPKPDFNWLDLTTSLCSGSANINFNVISPDRAVLYLWSSPQMSATDVIIKDTNDANTAISFLSAGDKEITVQATSTGTVPFCNSTVTRIVKVNSTPGIDERKIFLKQPGNLLVYPDNSMDVGDGYQWGFDPIIKTEPDTVLGSPVAIQGQVYQFFTPDTNFTHNTNTLDVSNYTYWVLLKKGNCYSKVYYNGPFARRPIPVPTSIDNAVQLKVVPNPNNGIFDIALNGNIYGKMEAKIYNSTGQLVVVKSFVKTTAGLIEKPDADHLPAGLYYLILNSSDLKKAATRFIIQ